MVQKTRLQVYTSTTGSYWDHPRARLSRGWNSLILPEATKHDILEDCRRFLRSRAWFAQRGLPYRRGYLLHGLPGTGKTTTSTHLPSMGLRADDDEALTAVTAIATELGLDIYVINLNSTEWVRHIGARRA